MAVVSPNRDLMQCRTAPRGDPAPLGSERNPESEEPESPCVESGVENRCHPMSPVVEGRGRRPPRRRQRTVRRGRRWRTPAPRRRATAPRRRMPSPAGTFRRTPVRRWRGRTGSCLPARPAGRWRGRRRWPVPAGTRPRPTRLRHRRCGTQAEDGSADPCGHRSARDERSRLHRLLLSLELPDASARVGTEFGRGLGERCGPADARGMAGSRTP